MTDNGKNITESTRIQDLYEGEKKKNNSRE